MKILIVNCGSSSIKYQLHDTIAGCALANGIVSNIGEEVSYLNHEAGGMLLSHAVVSPTHRAGFEIVIETLLSNEYGVLPKISEVLAVGHRIAHGGNAFTESTLITEEVIRKIEEIVPLAPLHNPANLLGVREAMRLLPNVPHVAVFDTTFHQTMSPVTYLYALPYEYYERYGIRRYGFHGTSCQYVSEQAAKFLGKPLAKLKMVICHLGNGVTLDAIAGGKSIDTSMGFTPLEGLMMGTRSGNIDPGVIFFLNRKVGLSVDQIDDILNRKSGLLGISGISNDIRKVIDGAESGNKRCQLALDMFAYRVRKYIGSYAAALGGINTLVFTAGIGENSPCLRAKICRGLEFLGIAIDDDTNETAVGRQQVISKPGASVETLVIPTDEGRSIVLATLAVTGIADRA